VNRQEFAASLLPSLPQEARILIIRLRSIGDIILLTPALRLLKGWRPDLRISVVVEYRFRELLEGNPDVEEILEPGSGAGLEKIVARYRALRELHRRKFSLCVNLHGGPTSTLLARASGARWKAGFEHFRSRQFYQFLIPDARTILDQPNIHTAEHQASAFFYLGMPRQEIPRAQLGVGATHQGWWIGKRAALGISPPREYALIHPAALYATKQWAPEHFAELGAHLERETGLATVFSCGPGERPVLDAVERAAGVPLRRVEGAGLGEFAAVLAEARLFVGNDSGPAHMAAALGRPCVVIFGSSSSRIWGPWPPSIGGRVVQNPYDCNPCPGDRCYRFERPECILSISFDQVRSAVEAVLLQSAQTSR
jgi:ADP-heptose:LPS heptosyltransferase